MRFVEGLVISKMNIFYDAHDYNDFVYYNDRWNGRKF